MSSSTRPAQDWIKPDSTDFDVSNVQSLQIAVNIIIYTLLDATEILIAIRFLINSRYIQWCPPVESNRRPTRNRLAFFWVRIKLGYNFYCVNRFRIELELQFFKVNWILDHQSYIIDRVNLNIDWVRFFKYSISHVNAAIPPFYSLKVNFATFTTPSNYIQIVQLTHW